MIFSVFDVGAGASGSALLIYSHKMQKEELRELLRNIIEGKASDQEIRLFNRYYKAYQDEDSDWNSDEMGEEQQVHDELKQSILNRIRPVKVVPLWKRPLPVAAAVAATLLICSILFFTKSDDRDHILAGRNTAVLTLGNGKTIPLNENKNGLVIEASKIRYNDGTSVSAHVVGSDTASTALLKISTPRGGTYEVILADGTHVWLNAASKLEFPAQFSGKQRLVSLTGEGYFEVAANKEKPFKVLSGGQAVEVLGTHFDINAYEDEQAIKTTLLEGTIVVSSESGYEILKPGDQAINTNNRISVSKVNVNIPVAWKNKQFLFERENIRSIMRMVERWYNVDVSYSGEISEETFSGGVSRFDKLSEVLKSLESTGKVRFEVKDRTVHVSM